MDNRNIINDEELNPLRKNATVKTALENEEVLEEIDWQQYKVEEALTEANSIIDVPYPFITREGSIIPVWNLRRYKFLNEDPIEDTCNPKLWLQGKLNMNAGLFKVTDNIYQVRGFDLANITFIKGRRGFIVIDCLTSKETAAAALELLDEKFPGVLISAIIITHSHVDHYGGVEGILEGNVVDDIKVYAPNGFTAAVIEENINAGVAMSRRSIYMYGEALLRDRKGQVDCGIGKYVSIGNITLSDVEEIVKPDDEVIVEKVIDGVTLQFQLTPDTEAPAEMNIYIPKEKSLCIAENCTATLHNIYTLRGAKVRDPVAWAYYIQQAMDLFGDTLTSVFMVHNWPRHGREYCLDYMSKQRDMYQYMNDQTLRLINKGYTLEDVGRMVKFPDSIKDEWYNGQFYGTVNHNCKAIYQRYIGWYNGNPVDLNKLFPEESAKRYVEYMGGADAILEKAVKDFELGEYQWVAEVTKQVIYADPSNRKAKLLCADALEQLGYIAESGPWRNEYLVGAWELRFGNTPLPGTTITDAVLDAMPLSNVLYLFSIRVDGLEAGDFDFKINFIIPDREEDALTELKRGIFRVLDDKASKDADVTVIMNKDTLYELATTNNKPDSSSIIVEGDICKWQLFLWTQDSINKDFNIVTPVPK